MKLAILFLVSAFCVCGATRFCVGGGSSTSFTATGPTNWSASSGGANNASVPTTGDTATFDSNSFAAGCTSIVVTASTGNIATETFTGYTGTFTINTGVHNGFTSSLTLASTMTLVCNGTGFFDFLGTGAGTITTGGVSVCGLTIGGTGTLTLQDNFTSASGSNITITAGELEFNAKTATTEDLVSSGATARTLDMTNATLDLPGTGTVLSFSGSNLTLISTGSTINITDTSSTAKIFAGGGNSFGTFNTSGGVGAVTITGANSFTTFTPAAGASIIFPASTTNTVTNLVVVGTPSSLITLKSNTTGTQATISRASGTVSGEYVFLRDINFTGGATFNCTWCNNFSDNTGINFLSPTQVGAFLTGP